MHKRAYLELSRSKSSYQLWRLTTEEYTRLRENSFPIRENFKFYLDLYLDEQRHGKFNLAKIYVTLEYLFGPSDNYFDSWKGSFNFPLLLKVKRKFFYLLNLYDHRGTLLFQLYKIVEARDDCNIDIVRDPDETEFSEGEIYYFCNYFYGCLEGGFKVLKHLPRQPFLKQIRSNFIVYGYENGRFFEEAYSSEEAYSEAIADFENTHGTAYRKVDVRRLIEEIIT